MIKVVHIAKPLAGVGIYISLLVKHFDNKSFKHIILCNTNDNIPEIKDIDENNIQLINVNLEREINVFQDLKSLIKIIQELKKIQPDIIHCHSAKAGILGRIAGAYLGISTLYTPHAYSYLSAESKKKRVIFKSIERIFNFFPSKTLACSSSEFQRTIKDLNFKKSKVLLWNNSIENNLKFEKTNQQLPKNFICSIGRPSYQKNTEFLVRSIQKVKEKFPDIHLLILGVGHFSPELNKVNVIIEELGLISNITLIPWLKRSETLSILKKANIYISTSRYEGLPYAALEAISLSKACVLTNVDGHKDIVSNGINGYLVNQNADDIANAIIKVLKNPDLKNQMEKASKSIYNEKFNIKNNISLLEQIYLQQLQ